MAHHLRGIKPPLQLLGSDESAQLGECVGDVGRVGARALDMRRPLTRRGMRFQEGTQSEIRWEIHLTRFEEGHLVNVQLLSWT